MTTDYIFHIIYATITNFDIITISIQYYCHFYQNVYPVKVKIFVMLL